MLSDRFSFTPQLNRYVNVTKLKYYFNVSNSYVFNKIALVVFPFRNKHWTRLVNRSEQDGQMEGYKPPREDLNAPDMYIPVMAIVTYVLLVGMLLGSNKDGRTFSPDALGTTASSAIFFIAVELMVMKLGCYLLNVQNEVPSLDIISLCGYKFLGVNSAVTSKIFFSYKVVYSIFAYHMLAFFFFTLRTMKYLLLPDASDTAVIVPQRQRRVYFLFGFALFQTVMAFTLVYAV
ncbi:hypothetical protein DFJ73DRAFT_816973 [Zopfochytrium polystomum]|nr:hypothetical protein DFJ73DRAFT_816973 [Zopfochytrium polystomum]